MTAIRLLPLFLAFGVSSLLSIQPAAAVAKDGVGEVRVAAVCGRGATAQLRLKSKDGGIELRFALDHGRGNTVWRVVIVQERRVAWKGATRTTRHGGSFDVRQTLQDLPGADSVTAQAWGPQGLVCRATATLPQS